MGRVGGFLKCSDFLVYRAQFLSRNKKKKRYIRAGHFQRAGEDDLKSKFIVALKQRNILSTECDKHVI